MSLRLRRELAHDSEQVKLEQHRINELEAIIRDLTEALAE